MQPIFSLELKTEQVVIGQDWGDNTGEVNIGDVNNITAFWVQKSSISDLMVQLVKSMDVEALVQIQMLPLIIGVILGIISLYLLWVSNFFSKRKI